VARFESLFKKYIKDTDYKYNPNKSLAWNESNLKRMAFLENSCRALYEKLDGTFGEEYAESVLTNVLLGNFVITNFEKYPFPEFKSLSERVLMVEYLNRSPLKSDGNIGAHTLITFYTSVVRELLSVNKHSASIELYDFFICLGLMIEKWRITEYPKYIVKRLDDVETLLKQFVKHVINAMYSKEGDIQNITLAILDKRLFEDAIKAGDYSVVIDKDTGERLNATYDIYLSGLRMYFDIIKGTQNSKELLQPAIRTYAVASSKLKAEVLECIESETGIDIGVVFDIFKHVNFDANPQWLDSPEYKAAFEKIEEIKTRKKDVNFINLKWKLKDIFGTDYINYLNICNKKLAYFLREYEIEKNVPSYETIFYKSNYDWITPLVKGNFSEVVINAKFIMDNSKTQEEFKDKLYKAVLDAQAINQMRILLVLPKGTKPTNRYNLNVKLDGLDDDLKSFAWSIMSEATEYLKSTYLLNFTFEISQRMFFRDKSRQCYLLL